CCEQDDRRDAVRRMNGRNGLDYVDVSQDQLTLTAYFLGKLPTEFQPDAPGRLSHLAIEGGRRITGIRIEEATSIVDPGPEKAVPLLTRLARPGDFSTYTLRLVDMANIDPRSAHVDFSFRVDGPPARDGAPACVCEPAHVPE